MAMVSKPLSLSAFANLTGKSRRAIGKALAGVDPVDKHGTADLYPTREALAAIYSDGANEFALANTRLKTAQADKAEKEVAEMDGILLPVIDVTQEWGSMVMAMRAKILALPGNLATQVVGMDIAEIEAEAGALVREALAELSADDSSPDGRHTGGHDGPATAAAETDGQPVV